MKEFDKQVVQFALMFHDTGKVETKTTDENGVDHFKGHAKVSTDIAETVMRRMKMSNDMITAVCICVKFHGMDITPDKKSVKRAIRKIGVEHFQNVMAVKVADDMAKDVNRADVFQRIRDAGEIMLLFHQIIAENAVFNRSGLVVNGNDMIKIGFVGAQIRSVLDAMVEFVIESPNRNERAVLEAFAIGFFKANN